MENKDIFSEIIKSKLENHESMVSPDIWNAVNSSVSPVSSVLKLSILKIVTAVSIVSAVGVTYFLSVNSADTVKPKSQIEKVQGIDNNSRIQVDVDEVGEPVVNSVSSSNESQITPKEQRTNEVMEVLDEYSTAIEEHESAINVVEPIQTTNYPVVLSNKETEPIQSVLEPKDNGIVEEVNSFQDGPVKIILPNVFTPNNDGVNDVLSLQLDPLTDFSVVIMDRSNKVVFQSTEASFSWDGTNPDGSKVAAGDYVYYVVGKDVSGKTVTAYSALRIQY